MAAVVVVWLSAGVDPGHCGGGRLKSGNQLTDPPPSLRSQVQERASTMYHLLVSYSIAKEEEAGEALFQPGEGGTKAIMAADGSSSADDSGSDEGSVASKPSKAGKGMKAAANGKGK